MRTEIASFVATLALGLTACQAGELFPGYNNLIVGDGAGQSLLFGSCDIIIGHTDVLPGTSYYLSVDGVIYPNSARWDPAFQALVRRRALELVREMGKTIDPATIEYYFANDICVPGTGA